MPAHLMMPSPESLATRSPREQAEDLLVRWEAANARRDVIVWKAFRAGVSMRRIHELTGLARSTVYRILLSESARLEGLVPASGRGDSG